MSWSPSRNVAAAKAKNVVTFRDPALRRGDRSGDSLERTPAVRFRRYASQRSPHPDARRRRAFLREAMFTNFGERRKIDHAVYRLSRSALSYGLVVLFLVAACTPQNSYVRRAPSGVPLAPNITCATPDCKAYNVRPYGLTRTQFTKPALPIKLPATFFGNTPCLDCGGNVTVTLNLYPNNTFREFDVYRRGGSSRTSGTWRYEFSSDTLTLFVLNRISQYYRLKDGSTLDFLD
jgi:hypothetical protein